MLTFGDQTLSLLFTYRYRMIEQTDKFECILNSKTPFPIFTK